MLGDISKCFLADMEKRHGLAGWDTFQLLGFDNQGGFDLGGRFEFLDQTPDAIFQVLVEQLARLKIHDIGADIPNGGVESVNGLNDLVTCLFNCPPQAAVAHVPMSAQPRRWTG